MKQSNWDERAQKTRFFQKVVYSIYTKEEKYGIIKITETKSSDAKESGRENGQNGIAGILSK